MSETEPGTQRERLAPTYIVLGVFFVLLAALGVFTVALPELEDQPERAPDAGAPATSASAPAATPPGTTAP